MTGIEAVLSISIVMDTCHVKFWDGEVVRNVHLECSSRKKGIKLLNQAREYGVIRSHPLDSECDKLQFCLISHLPLSTLDYMT